MQGFAQRVQIPHPELGPTINQNVYTHIYIYYKYISTYPCLLAYCKGPGRYPKTTTVKPSCPPWKISIQYKLRFCLLLDAMARPDEDHGETLYVSNRSATFLLSMGVPLLMLLCSTTSKDLAALVAMFLLPEVASVGLCVSSE